MNPEWLLDRATEFEVYADPRRPWDTVCVRKCTGYKLPKEPMWKVSNGSATLDHQGNWEVEPQPSIRDSDYYARCRFNTLNEAWQAAEAAVREIERRIGRRSA